MQRIDLSMMQAIEEGVFNYKTVEKLVKKGNENILELFNQKNDLLIGLKIFGIKMLKDYLLKL